MPSDTLLDGALEALTRPLGAYRSAVATSIEELRSAISAHEYAGSGRADRLSRELGSYAVGRIDAASLAGLLSDGSSKLPPASIQVLERALDVMEAVDASDPVNWTLQVPAGGDLRDTVRHGLHDVGVAFGAARAAELARSGSYRAEAHNDLFSGRPFHQWSPAERTVAPPLVVRLHGMDLRPAGLADFLDGEMKIVLLVEGLAPPAALARVITPGVAVVQTRDLEGLELLREIRGPALAAVFDSDADGVVPFVHDPRGGDLPWERLWIEIDPEELDRRTRDTRTKNRAWGEDLAHLAALAAPPGTPADPSAGVDEAPTGASVEKVAAWLLARTELDDVEQDR